MAMLRVPHASGLMAARLSSVYGAGLADLDFADLESGRGAGGGYWNWVRWDGNAGHRAAGIDTVPAG